MGSTGQLLFQLATPALLVPAAFVLKGVSGISVRLSRSHTHARPTVECSKAVLKIHVSL